MTFWYNIDELTSDAAKQHARDVLDNQDADFDEEAGNKDLHNTTTLASLACS